MTLAAIQFKPVRGQWERSAQALEALCAEAAQGGAAIVVCPEMALTGYLFPDPAAAAEVAEPTDGPTLARFSQVARRGGFYLVIGYPERAGARLYNSALVIGPSGELLYNYRKRLLFDADKPWAAPGDRPYPLLPTPLGTLTVGICMDMNDDEFIYFLRRTAAQVARGDRQPLPSPLLVAFCTNWLHEGIDIRPYWEQRIAGTPCLLIAADTYGTEDVAGCPPTRFLGRSAIIDYRPAPRRRRPQTLAFAPESGDHVLLAQPTLPLLINTAPNSPRDPTS